MILDIYLDEKCLISIEKDSQSMTCTGKVLIKTSLSKLYKGEIDINSTQLGWLHHLHRTIGWGVPNEGASNQSRADNARSNIKIPGSPKLF